jgi:hypothetical protein
MRRIALLLTAALMLSGCEREYPAGFIMLPGAEGARSYYVRGMIKAIYRMHAEFPAETTIAAITAELKMLGYEPLDHLFLYPQEPGGVKQGWTFYEQSKKKAGWMVYEWSTDWSDRNGNIISYALQYRDPIGKYHKNTFVMKPGNDTLVVNFVSMPKDVAIALRESLKPKESEDKKAPAR